MLHKLLTFSLLMTVLASCGTQKNESPAEEEIVETETEPQLMNLSATLELDAKAQLGEGAIWHPEEKKFYWIDIENKKLHIYDPADKSDREITMPSRIGTVVPAKEGGVLVALEGGIFHVDLETENLTLLNNPLEGQEAIRFNDGKCDPQGRFWVGSMKLDQSAKQADLYRFDTDGTAHHMLDSITISNGIVWSPDHKKMYYIDTPTGKVQGFDYDAETGEISNGEVVVQIQEGMGYPDGMTIDSEGMLWIGMWNGFGVTRWNPNTGEYLGKVEVPAQNVTACAFGDEDLSTLYITTASIGTDAQTLEKYPHCGGVFSVKTNFKGSPAFYYAGKTSQ
ncbi:SMP-30/gluconolactonase/LRE family protein [Flammeovirgaceae bacterium SG7u.111]|nr:SMP-30/gluconolactonase/LRE family protein [Flammeovirgaceae bacterium SG7u.132]WPO34935.1 SMP-30/gluconolactonase/LRE family protein [Flammeovirgaceae bacterium SG7u.111]